MGRGSNIVDAGVAEGFLSLIRDVVLGGTLIRMPEEKPCDFFVCSLLVDCTDFAASNAMGRIQIAWEANCFRPDLDQFSVLFSRERLCRVSSGEE